MGSRPKRLSGLFGAVAPAALPPAAGAAFTWGDGGSRGPGRPALGAVGVAAAGFCRRGLGEARLKGSPGARGDGGGPWARGVPAGAARKRRPGWAPCALNPLSRARWIAQPRGSICIVQITHLISRMLSQRHWGPYLSLFSMCRFSHLLLPI